MGTINLSLPTVGQPNSTEEAKIPTALTTIQNVINGNLDTANLAASAKPATLLGAYRTIYQTQGCGTSASVGSANGYSALGSSAGQTFVGFASIGIGWLDGFYFDPADYAVSGLTAKFRLRLGVMVNGTAPACTFNAQLQNITTVGGGAGVFAITGVGGALGATTTIVTPGANSISHAAGSDTSLPAAGTYVLALNTTAGIAANSVVQAQMQMQMRWV